MGAYLLGGFLSWLTVAEEVHVYVGTGLGQAQARGAANATPTAGYQSCPSRQRHRIPPELPEGNRWRPFGQARRELSRGRSISSKMDISCYTHAAWCGQHGNRTIAPFPAEYGSLSRRGPATAQDRKSTRLNSSH